MTEPGASVSRGEDEAELRTAIADARRVVVKVGSSSISSAERVSTP